MIQPYYLVVYVKTSSFYINYYYFYLVVYQKEPGAWTQRQKNPGNKT